MTGVLCTVYGAQVFHQYKAFTRGFQQKKYERLQQQTYWENEYAKMLYVTLFGFNFRFLGGQKMVLPSLDFSRLFVCSLYSQEGSNNVEKVNVAICSHVFLDWLAYFAPTLHMSVGRYVGLP